MMSTHRPSSVLLDTDVSLLDTGESPAFTALESGTDLKLSRVPPIPKVFLGKSLIADGQQRLIEPIGLPQRPNGRGVVLQPSAELISLPQRGDKQRGLLQHMAEPISLPQRGDKQRGLLQHMAEPISLPRRQSVQMSHKWPLLQVKWQQLALKIVLPPLLALVLPFLIYAVCASCGFDISSFMYIVVVIALVTTAYLIMVEALTALRTSNPLNEPALPYPPASAIIAAYLPNEVATIVETVEAMLRIDYPAPLQVILAYNTPHNLPIEDELRKIALRDPRLVLLRVANSTSKAQNVNRALDEVTGAFVGIFDADHHPASNAFTRAWRWLAQGYDVVQGHCIIRNQYRNWITRLIAVEFEVMYALCHPGRARLHGFGIFGGANGYWRTDLLRQIGMDQFMLTEDIDASMRAIHRGYKIVSDPFLISRELAPETLRALWNQRMRWAQGWFQVTLKHLLPALCSPHLSLRQKLGAFHLLAWREIYFWLSVQAVPILAFQLWHGNVKWFAPLLVLSSIFTFGVGPLQTLLAYILAAPDIKRHRSWFVFYAVLSLLCFVEFKNHIARIAQLQEFLGEREWKVTPRSTNQILQAMKERMSA